MKDKGLGICEKRVKSSDYAETRVGRLRLLMGSGLGCTMSLTIGFVLW